MGATMSGVVPLGDPSFLPASETDAFIASFCWQSLSGGVMIGAEVGRMTSRFGERRVPKYGGFSACSRHNRYLRRQPHFGGRTRRFECVGLTRHWNGRLRLLRGKKCH